MRCHLRGLHSGINQLLEWLAGLNALMLPRVSDKQYAVTGLQLGEEVTDLFRAGKTGLIDHVQVPLGIGSTDTREEALYGVGRDSGISELVRST